jgi:hypothetical protein
MALTSGVPSSIPVLSGVHVSQSLVFRVVVCTTSLLLAIVLSVLQLLIIPLVSSNFSCNYNLRECFQSYSVLPLTEP